MCSCQWNIIRYSNMEYASLHMLIGRYDSKKDVPYLDPDSVLLLSSFRSKKIRNDHFNDLTIFEQMKRVYI